ncbi:MAG: NAD(P)H-hydrate dehydratase [Chlorobiaceae bacterium]
MLPVLNALEMQGADKAAIEELHIGETRLMELAGRESVRIIRQTLQRESLEESAFLVVCGKGNNGGDGFVIARHLVNLGASVDLVLLYSQSALTGVNLEGFATLEAYRARTENLRIFRSCSEALPFVAETSYDALIDAITGTGLRIEKRGAELPSPLSDGIELLNTIGQRSSALTIAVDLPSGLDAATGFAAFPVVEADVTATMAFLKRGFYLNDGPEFTGEVHICEISIPKFLIDDPSVLLADETFAAESFILRERSSAKHTNGRVLVIAGSSSSEGGGSMLGAAILAAKGALESGAGYVAISIPPELAPAMHVAVPEAVVIGREFSVIAEKACWADAILIGCGLGRDDEAFELVSRLLANAQTASKKLILDADALYALSRPESDGLPESGAEIVITPHYGEFSRLSGSPVDAIAADPIGSALDYARLHGINVLLKGSPTVIAAPQGPAILNTSGTEALATAGSGDVLSGMIAALAAKGAGVRDAAAAAAWFHGRAGDLACNVASLVNAGMIVEGIRKAIEEIFEFEE